MKNLKLILGILIFIMSSHQSFSQEFTLDNKTITGVFDAKDQTKSEIFSSINKWISLNYNSAQSVVQLNDKEAGNIIVKGVNEVVYKNVMKELNPDNKYMQEFNTIKFNHTIEINTKDNKYRIIYTLTDIVSENTQMYNLDELNKRVFEMINLTGLKQEAVDNYNIFIEVLWGKAKIKEEKRKKMMGMTKPVFEELIKDVRANIKLTMADINNSLNSSKNEDW